MKPFILQFAEEFQTEPDDLPIEYSANLNLTVISKSQIPAINSAKTHSNTFTKAQGEANDWSLRLQRSKRLDMQTFTRTQESTDPISKLNQYSKNVSMDTHTLVKREATDTSQFSRIARRMSLESLTEAREATDVK